MYRIPYQKAISKVMFGKMAWHLNCKYYYSNG